MSVVTCPDCKGMVSESALACPHCGWPVDSVTSPYVPLNESAAAPRVEPVIEYLRALAVVTFIGLLVLVFVYAGRSSESIPPSSSTSSPGNSPEATISDKGGTGKTLVYASEQAFNEGNEAAAANDKVGFRQILDRGDSFTVADGTHCVVLNVRWDGGCNVRLSSGDRSGQLAWINTEWIHGGEYNMP